MKVLVCGGRKFTNYDAAEKYLDMLNSIYRFALVIHGNQQGADACADRWARSRHIDVQAFPAAWVEHGNSAGPIRNGRMLREGKPDLVVAFPGNRGTRDMLKQSRRVPNLKIINLDEANVRTEVERQWRTVMDRSIISATGGACPNR
ncbi:DUF2493 domain-containing protein [Bradyrhizobium sp. 1(2017)]|uniref:DUF2493 domain-containing protein n=1 Tax=Bradyrhizobium sp. 1(2017) TaxID=1404888 RepID=UPI00140EA8AE|nr:DUF2493 domain-containing protein [Bradyrhizobium sp. 1(2017)]QIO34333.1 DUF2493 domain-containing protein [Bradyrhizobium sp. 1(2017)]